jgi:hypothetical protein
MKKTNKLVLVIVLILVVAFGVGQFFAGLGPVVAHTPSSSAQATQVTYYTPPALTSSTPVEKGSCWTNSIAAPFRPDAWRCAIGNGIQDPCFQIAGSTSTLLCGVNPARPVGSSTFALNLTKPLPLVEVFPSSTPNNAAWLIELQDGTLCSPFTGTRPFTADGQTANYDCAPKVAGGDGLLIFGDLNASTSPWTAIVGTLSNSTSTFPPVIVSSSSVPVVEVWE